MTKDETGKLFTYDAWNRLKTVKSAGRILLVSYNYDAKNQRIQEVPGTGSTVDLYYSSGWQVIEERVGGTTRKSYVWSPVYFDAMVARDFDSDNNGSLEQRLYPTHDANFNVTSLVNTSGAVVERYTYDPFGAATTRNASWTVTSPAYGWQYLHQGGRLNAKSGFYSFRYREYSPTLGRYTVNDPLRFNSDSYNMYKSVSNNPVRYIDPLGLRTAECLFSNGSSFWSEKIECDQPNTAWSCCNKRAIGWGLGTAWTIRNAIIIPAPGYNIDPNETSCTNHCNITLGLGARADCKVESGSWALAQKLCKTVMQIVLCHPTEALPQVSSLEQMHLQQL